MKNLIINFVAGSILFAGALVGTLAATGRLNHEGVANIPGLNRLMPAPPVDPDHADASAGGALAGMKAADGVETAGDPRDFAAGNPVEDDASHPQAQTARPMKRGRSIFESDATGDGGGHGDTHADSEDSGDHAPAGSGHTETVTPDPPDTGQGPVNDGGAPSHAAEQDLHRLEQRLAQDRKSRYSPGGYFRFDGMPSGISSVDLNEAWKRVQEAMADLDKRGQALDLQEKELREFADDIGRRQTELGRERVEILDMQMRLDERIDQFRAQVKLVRTDEIAGLKRNAKTMESFEASKAAELIQEQWKLESGQDEVLKMFEVMDKDSANSIIEELPNAMIREVLRQRLRVSREASSSSGK